jgi:ATP-binding protein involved in chromosome partitioning
MMSAKEDKAGREEEIKISLALSQMKNRLLVFSGKGGVGKSTVAANLALALVRKGDKVGLLDVDIHGPNLAKMLGVEDKKLDVSSGVIKPVEVKKNLKLVSMSFLLQDPDLPVIWRGPMKMKAIQQFLGDVKWGELDWLVIDSPPGTGDEPLSVAQLIPATGAVVVTTPQEVSLMDSRKAVAFARRLNLKVLGIIENMSGMVCPHCGKRIDLFKEGGGQRAALELGVPFLGKIPLDPEIVTLGDEGKAFIDIHPQSEASQAFMRVVDNIIKNNTRSS